MAGKGSLKQSRSVGGDAQQPSASKKKRSPGTDAVNNDAAPSNATAGVAINPTINDNAINGKSTVEDAAPTNATGGNTANPTINNDTGRGVTSSNGTADVVCDASYATTGVDGDNEETSNAAIDMAALSPTVESSTNTLVDNTVATASNDNDNNVAAVVQVASQMVRIIFNYSVSLHDSDVGKFLMKQMKLSLKTNYSKMELFYFKQQTKTPSPSKLATATSIVKKT
jgi:hypothetical protein